MTVNLEVEHSQSGELTARRYGTVALYAIGCFLLTFILMHFLEPEFSPARRFGSEYALGKYGYLMNVAFFALGIGLVALARCLQTTVGGTLGPISLVVAGLMVFLSGVFQTDPTIPAGPATTEGRIHNSLGLASFILIIVAMFATAWRARRRAALRRYAKLTGIAAVGATAAFPLVPILGSQGQGIGQRTFIAIVVLWQLLTAQRFRARQDG